MSDQCGHSASPRLPSAADLEIAVHAALSAHDVEAAVGLLRLMVPQDPRRAARLYDLLVIALEIAMAERAPAVEPDEQHGGDIRGSRGTEDNPMSDAQEHYPRFAPDAELVVDMHNGHEVWSGADWNAYVASAERNQNMVTARLIECPPSLTDAEIAWQAIDRASNAPGVHSGEQAEQVLLRLAEQDPAVDRAVYGGAIALRGPGRSWGVVHVGPEPGVCSVDVDGCGYCIGTPCERPNHYQEPERLRNPT